MSIEHSSPSLHAACYADRAEPIATAILENVRVARDTFRLRFAAPRMAGKFLPGQFLMLRLAGRNDPLLGRPLALYDVILDAGGQPLAIDVVYLVQGKLTKQLARAKPGDLLDVWGPLGNGFSPEPTEHLIMVAGGIGQTPFLAVAKQRLGRYSYGRVGAKETLVERITFCYGARTADYFSGLDDFAAAGVELRLSTDDGSRGHKGLVTEVLREVLAESTLARRIVACGPERMLEAVAHVATEAGVPCQVSLETPMACGIGICFTCVAKIRDTTGAWDYKRTCVEGPIFDATAIEW